MAGNVWVWVQDWYGDYPKSVVPGAAKDPQGASSGSGRVLRGGGWGYDPRDLRSARRYGFAPGVRYGVVGFRLVRTAR